MQFATISTLREQFYANEPSVFDLAKDCHQHGTQLRFRTL